MTIIDKLNALLQKAINYTQEGFREAGYDIDFQNATNPNSQTGYPQQGYVPQQQGYDQQSGYPQQQGYPQQNYEQQAYPKHPNVDPANYNPNPQQTFININQNK